MTQVYYAWWGPGIPYTQAWTWQREQVRQRLVDPQLPDVVALLEHQPVYTLGRGASLQFLRLPLAELGVPVYRTERGGEVTYHGPGQVVGYPILRLSRYGLDVHQYLRALEEVIIQTLRSYAIAAGRKTGYTGVWVGDTKVAAIGIALRRGVTMHGFAVNVCTDLAAFSRIVPCGIAAYPVGNLVQFCPGLTVMHVQQALVQQMERVFGMTMEQAPPISIRC
ncbi:MAG: lipoyl(octanoyl) transferase LipB [Gloeomargarita sp. GMQP_bins_120]